MAFLGMRGTGDWPENLVPDNWREMILYLYPNGDAPLTAIMSMLGSESTDSPTFHWWSKGMPAQEAVVQGVFTDTALTTNPAAYNALSDGAILYLKLTPDEVSQFRYGHEVALDRVDSDTGPVVGDPRFNIICKVVNRAEAGDDDSFIGVRLLEGSDVIPSDDAWNYVSVVGNMNPEGATMPDAIMYEEEESYNYTQIFRTPLSITRTAKKTRLRHGTDAYENAKMEALELHALELEWAFIFGERSSKRGANGKPERTTRGIVKALQRELPANFLDYRRDSRFSGQTWLQGGQEWLNLVFEELSNWGNGEKFAMHGSGAGLGIQALVDAGADYNITARDTDYGLRVKNWVTPNLEINLKKSPLFGRRLTTVNSMLIFEPRFLRFRYIDDTRFKEDVGDEETTRNNSKDATEEEYLTEAGLEYHFLETAVFLSGIGEDNIV